MKKLTLFPLLVLALLLGSLLSASVFAKPAAKRDAADCNLTWNEIPVPNVGGLYGLGIISREDIWAGGGGDWLHWDGNTWTVVPKPINGFVNAFAATASDDVWAVGSIQSIPRQSFVMHWDGKEWTTQHQQERDMHRAVLALAPDSVWAVGSHSWHWDGKTWTEIPSPYYMNDLAGVAPDDLWAVGSNGIHLSSPYAWHWDGTKWSEPFGFGYIGVAAGLRGVSALANNDVWAVGAGTFNSLAVHWDGKQWTEVKAPGSYLADVVAVDPENVYAVGDVIAKWDGVTWNLQAELTARSLDAVDAISKDEVIAVGFSVGEDGAENSLVMQGTLPCVEPTLTAEPLPTDIVTPEPTQEACVLASPKLLDPAKNASLDQDTVDLAWQKQLCATRYQVVVKPDSKDAKPVFRAKTHKTKITTPTLAAQHVYYWRVRACDIGKCSGWSKWRRFMLKGQ